MPELNSALAAFLQQVNEMPGPRVLELGTKRAFSDRSTMHKAWIPHAAAFIGTDYQNGLDVDVVADVHCLSSAFPEESFDVVISCSTFEHIKYPWIAAVEIARCLRLGGCVFVQTHQTYPLHGAPYDYWRFTRDGLAALFHPKIGMDTIACCHEFPCSITTEEDPGAIASLDAFLNTCLCAIKIAATPGEWLPDL